MLVYARLEELVYIFNSAFLLQLLWHPRPQYSSVLPQNLNSLATAILLEELSTSSYP